MTHQNMQEASLRCYVCEVEKPIDSFRQFFNKRNSKTYRKKKCAICEDERWRARYYAGYKDRKLVLDKAWIKNNTKLSRSYGLKSREKFKDRHESRYIFRKAVMSGKIKRLPCEVCGDKKSQGHHEDYSKPLEVIWLCRTHHEDRHRKPIPSLN